MKDSKRKGLFSAAKEFFQKVLHLGADTLIMEDDRVVELDAETGAVSLIEGDNKTALDDGTYKTASGEVLKVVDGKGTLEQAKLGANLSAAIESAIAAKLEAEGEEVTREQIEAELVEIAGGQEAFDAIMGEEMACPTEEALAAMAEVLNVEADALQTAAVSDGCEYATGEAEGEEEEETAETEAVMLAKAIGTTEEKLAAALKASKTALRKAGPVKLSRKPYQLTKEQKEELAAFVLEDKSIVYIDPATAEVYLIDENLNWLGYMPAGDYRLDDGRLLVVYEETITFDEGTEWEYSYTVSKLDPEMSEIEPEEIVTWMKVAASTIKEHKEKLSAAEKRVQELEKEVKDLKNQPAADAVEIPKSGKESFASKRTRAENLSERILKLNQTLGR